MDKTGKRIEELRSKSPENKEFRVEKTGKDGKKRSPVGLWAALLLCLAVLGGVIAFGYSLISGRMESGAKVSGVDVGGMVPEEAEQMLRQLTQTQTVTLRDEDGSVLFTLPLTALAGEQDYSANLRSALDGGPHFTYSPEAVSLAVNAALFAEGYEAQEPTDAVLSIDESGFSVQEATHGNLYDAEACTRAICSYLDAAPSFGGIWDVRVSEAYERTGRDADEALMAQKALVEDFTSAEVSIEFVGGITYTLSFADIYAMLNEDCLTSGAEVKIVPERVSARMDEICRELGVDGVMAKYGRCADTREYLYLLPKDTGYTLDRAALDAQVCEALEQRQGQLTAVYDYTQWLKKAYGWHGDVNNCLEISLDNQYIWFYHDGQLLTESPIVSGDLATNCITRLGIFQIYGMVEDTVLKGATWNDHVDYWMPFDDQIGIHDSDWRDEYGGDIYKEHGSHGCVNTPIDAMRTVYENSFYGMLVIVR